VWIAVLGSVKLFTNLEAALKGVFNRVLKNLRKVSTRFHSAQEKLTYGTVRVGFRSLWGRVLEKNARHETAVSHMLVLMSKNKDDANGALRVALRAVAKPGLAIEL
jgi:hypothetical protein